MVPKLGVRSKKRSATHIAQEIAIEGTRTLKIKKSMCWTS